MKSCRIAVDIGGTFTDAVLEANGQLFTSKLSTTAENPELGFQQIVEDLLIQSGVSANQVTSIVHGTTLATNALIERRGARVGVITTDGFRDILEIGYERRYDQYETITGQV